MRMGVTVYIFDANRRIRRVLPDVTELLHTESDGTLEAVFSQTAGATPGADNVSRAAADAARRWRPATHPRGRR